MSRSNFTRPMALLLTAAFAVWSLFAPAHSIASVRMPSRLQAQALSLQSTLWHLTHVDGNASYYAPQPPYFVPVSYTLNFFGDPWPYPDPTVPISRGVFNLGGAIQCNTLNARYAVNGAGAMTITVAAVSNVFCITPDDGIEAKYLPYLQGTTRYQLTNTPDGAVLFLYDADGRERLRFADHYVWKPYFLPAVIVAGQ